MAWERPPLYRFPLYEIRLGNPLNGIAPQQNNISAYLNIGKRYCFISIQGENIVK